MQYAIHVGRVARSGIHTRRLSNIATSGSTLSAEPSRSAAFYHVCIHPMRSTLSPHHNDVGRAFPNIRLAPFGSVEGPMRSCGNALRCVGLQSQGPPIIAILVASMRVVLFGVFARLSTSRFCFQHPIVCPTSAATISVRAELLWRRDFAFSYPFSCMKLALHAEA